MAAHEHSPATRWRLVGPWYRWPQPGLPASGLGSRPAIQMFAGDDFMTGFLARPQHSLQADPVVDVVQAHDLVGAGSFTARVAALFPLRADGSPAPRLLADGSVNKEAVFRARLAPGSLRKLYQPTHDRHYLVTCELHCDEPGFPRVARQRVCQAGFVLRRRRSVVPAGVTAAEVEAEHAKVRRAEAELYELQQLQAATQALDMLGRPDTLLRANAAARQAARVAAAAAGDPRIGSWPDLMKRAQAEVTQARIHLAEWLKTRGITTAVDGWFPRLVDGRPSPTQGEWKALDGDEQTADPLRPPAKADPHAAAEAAPPTEHVLPLRPLIADPRDTGHDAAGRTLYHGLVPTHSLQHEARGRPRFDPHETYELRCFVRAHHDCPPRKGRHPDCHGPVVWSAASEPFRVAAAMDVLGSAQRPISIRMPDLRDLAAQAALRPRGSLSPVRFIQPQHLSPKGDGGVMGGEAICSFSIPLITIIALFVLNLFLPIVVFIFQLWFLLVFRFCIPPQIQAGAAVDAALAVTPPGVDLELGLSVQVQGGLFEADADALRSALHTALAARIAEDTGKTDEAPQFDGQDNNVLGVVDQSFSDNAALKPAAAGQPAPLPPETGTPLAWEPHVTPVWTPQGAGA